MQVLFLVNFSNDLLIKFSLSESTLEVASSKIKILGLPT